MAAPVVLVGARVIVNIGGKVFPLISDIAVSITTNNLEIREVDSMTAAELAPNTYSVSVDLTAFRVPTSSPTQLGLVPALNTIVTSSYIGLEIKDRLTDSTLFFSPNMRVDSVNFNVGARGTASNRISLKGIYSWDESGPNGETEGLINELLSSFS